MRNGFTLIMSAFALGASFGGTCLQAAQQTGAKIVPFRPPTGVLAHLNGVWTNGEFTWEVSRPDPRTTQIQFYQGQKPTTSWRIRSKADGKLDSAALLENYGVYDVWRKDALIFVATDRFMLLDAGVVKGRLAFTGKNHSYQGIFRRLSSLEERRWRQEVIANRNANGGGSGVLGALAMGVGAALAGGNTEQVMGMAMKGAELTTDNEMVRNVLAGQGEAFVAAGTQRAIDANNRKNGVGSSGGSAAASVNGSGATSRTETAMAGSSQAPGSMRKSVPVYFVVGIRPTERNTRNPMCYSTVFNIDVALDPNGWGNQGRINDALAPLKEGFLAKCSRHGQVDGVVNSAAQGISSGFPRPTPHREDYEVTMP